MFRQAVVEELTGYMFQGITTQLLGVVHQLELKAWMLLVVAVVVVTLVIQLLMDRQLQMEQPREHLVDVVDPASL
jgi:putative exporter of polyketide antibiotics